MNKLDAAREVFTKLATLKAQEQALQEKLTASLLDLHTESGKGPYDFGDQKEGGYIISRNGTSPAFLAAAKRTFTKRAKKADAATEEPVGQPEGNITEAE